MTLNGVIALILLYFTEFNSYASLLRHSIKGRPILSAESTFGQNWPTLQRGLCAIAELLVCYYDIRFDGTTQYGRP